MCDSEVCDWTSPRYVRVGYTGVVKVVNQSRETGAELSQGVGGDSKRKPKCETADKVTVLGKNSRSLIEI